MPSIARSRAICFSFFLSCLALGVGLALVVANILPMPSRLLAINPNAFHPFFAYAVGGMFVIHIMVFGASTQVLRASLIGLFLLASHLILIGVEPAVHFVLGTALYYQGVGSTLILAGMAWQQRNEPNHQQYVDILLAGTVMPLLILASRFFLDLSIVLHPHTYDAALFRFDGSMGFQASVEVARLMRSLPYGEELGRLVYAGLPVMVTVALALQIQSNRQDPDVLKVFTAMGALGYLIYFIYPVAGPVYLFDGEFPFRLPPPSMLSLDAEPNRFAPRNGVPSLHLAWAMGLWFSIRNRSILWRALFGSFVFLTVFATMGSGEHYLVDLVIALPFAIAVQAACASSFKREQRWILLGGASITVLWLIYLREGIESFDMHGSLHGAAIILTLLLCFYFDAMQTQSSAPSRLISIETSAETSPNATR